jgi:uncharacterized repeat protein (TIGR02543 family)
MNKTKRFLAGIIALSAITLFSCNNFAGGKVVEKANTSVTNEKTLLTISIDEMLTSAQRNLAVLENIMPSPWTTTSAGGLYFVLTGSKTSGGDNEITANNTFTYAQLTGGTASILLDSTTWYLTLTAYTEAAHTNIALVSSQEDIDLTGGAPSTPLSFTMKAPASTNALGSANITLEFIKPDNLTKIVYGLYGAGLPTSELVADSVVSDPIITVADMDSLTAVNAGINKYKVEYSKSSVKAGKYYFNAIFYGNGNQIICFYSDTIQIDGGNDTAKTISLSENAFNKPAVKPTSLTVSYSYNDSTDNAYATMKPAELADGESADSNFYATFTWNDVSDNETGFELVITDTANPTTPVTYSANSAVTDGVVKGSLSASSTSATIKLDTGKVYTAKIRATNAFTPAASTDSDYTACSSDAINLFTVTYNLTSGKVQKANGDTNATADTVVSYVIPYNKSSTTQSLLSDNTADYPFVFRTNYTFINWKNASNTVVTAIPADNTENLVLSAYWQSRLGVSIVMPNYSAVADYALVDSYSEAAVRTISGVQAEATTPVTVALTPNTGLTNVTWTAYDTDFATEIAGDNNDQLGIIDTTSGFTWTITDSAHSVLVAAGTYRIAVSGTYTDAAGTETAVTGNIYIKITR